MITPTVFEPPLATRTLQPWDHSAARYAACPDLAHRFAADVCHWLRTSLQATGQLHGGPDQQQPDQARQLIEDCLAALAAFFNALPANPLSPPDSLTTAGQEAWRRYASGLKPRIRATLLRHLDDADLTPDDMPAALAWVDLTGILLRSLNHAPKHRLDCFNDPSCMLVSNALHDLQTAIENLSD